MTHLDNSNNKPDINIKRLHHVCQCATSQQVIEGYPLKFLESPKAIPRNERANGLDSTLATSTIRNTVHTRTIEEYGWMDGVEGERPLTPSRPISLGLPFSPY